jgi:hypothetical protein
MRHNELCHLSASGRSFLDFRKQIWHVACIAPQAHGDDDDCPLSHNVVAEMAKGALPELNTLTLDEKPLWAKMGSHFFEEEWDKVSYEVKNWVVALYWEKVIPLVAAAFSHVPKLEHLDCHLHPRLEIPFYRDVKWLPAATKASLKSLRLCCFLCSFGPLYSDKSIFRGFESLEILRLTDNSTDSNVSRVLDRLCGEIFPRLHTLELTSFVLEDLEKLTEAIRQGGMRHLRHLRLEYFRRLDDESVSNLMQIIPCLASLRFKTTTGTSAEVSQLQALASDKGVDLRIEAAFIYTSNQMAEEG